MDLLKCTTTTPFAPDKETVTLMEPDFIFSWGSYFGDKKLGDVDGWNEKGVGTYMNSNTRPGRHPHPGKRVHRHSEHR